MKAIVITVRDLPAGYLGSYGNEWIATPNFDLLAAEGVVFDRHYADHPDPAGARRAWRTGCYHLPFPENVAIPPAPGGPDLIRLLAEQGVATALVLDQARPAPADGTTGWQQVYRIPAPRQPESTEVAPLLRTVGQAVDRLAGLDPWLLWLDLATLVPPWHLSAEYQDLYFASEPEAEDAADAAPPEPWTGPLPERIAPEDDTTFARLQGTFAGRVTLLDQWLGGLLQSLEERELLDDLFLVVTSDRGLALGEHGVAGAGVPWLHEEVVHVPLIVRLPGGAEAGRRVSGLTQAVDLLPTLVGALGREVPAVHGHDLLPLCRGETDSVRPYACSALRAGDSVEWALRTPQWAFLLPVFQGVEDTPRPVQLYVKPDDRWEVNNLCQHHPELAQHLEETLRGFLAATRRPGPLQAPALRDIKALLTKAEAGPGENPPTESPHA
jgi:arylsulfatase A-like enzyme